MGSLEGLHEQVGGESSWEGASGASGGAGAIRGAGAESGVAPGRIRGRNQSEGKLQDRSTTLSQQRLI